MPEQGNITRWLAERADSVTAVEADADACYALEQLGLGIEVVHAPIERYRPQGRFDCVVAVNVLEHIDDDVGALTRIRSWLVPDGWLFIFVPAHPLLYGPLDAKARHVHRSLSALRSSLAAAGFRGGWMKHIDALGGIGWFVAGRVLRVGRVSSATVSLTENLVVPVGRAVERLIHPPFGRASSQVYGATDADGADRRCCCLRRSSGRPSPQRRRSPRIERKKLPSMSSCTPTAIAVTEGIVTW